MFTASAKLIIQSDRMASVEGCGWAHDLAITWVLSKRCRWQVVVSFAATQMQLHMKPLPATSTLAMCALNSKPHVRPHDPRLWAVSKCTQTIIHVQPVSWATPPPRQW